MIPKINKIYNIDKVLFYEIKINQFRMLEMTTKNIAGDLMVTPRKDELFINSIHIDKKYRRKGLGKICLDFAKNLSIKKGFNGRLRCIAGYTPYDTKNPSHIFYRKYGFTTDNKEMLSDIDKAIKENRQLGSKSSFLTYMYYPEK